MQHDAAFLPLYEKNGKSFAITFAKFFHLLET